MCSGAIRGGGGPLVSSHQGRGSGRCSDRPHRCPGWGRAGAGAFGPVLAMRASDLAAFAAGRGVFLRGHALGTALDAQ